MNIPATRILYYVHDPMCSWCYAFAPALQQIETAIAGAISVQYVVGGLAPDSDQPMPVELQEKLQNTWRRIQTAVPGTEFNFDFWTHCRPRRSTYPACRAVLTAKQFDPRYEAQMIERIQHAYYREARNPSDVSTLCELAGEIGIDTDAFEGWIKSDACQIALANDLDKTRTLGVMGFPSLILATNAGLARIPCDHTNPQTTLAALGLGHSQ
jgi:putative protein-disulfide isomerase